MASTSTPTVADLAQQIREQLSSTVRQGQQISIDAAQGWVKAVSALPVVDLPAVMGTLPKVPGVTDMTAAPAVQAATTYTFDVAADLLAAQRDYSVQLAQVLVPTKSA